MHLGLGQRNTAMCVAVDLFQSDISVASGTDQQRIAEAELTERPDAVQTIRPLIAFHLPRGATEYLLWISGQLNAPMAIHQRRDQGALECPSNPGPSPLNVKDAVGQRQWHRKVMR